MLTQNTSWKNVEKALLEMKNHNCISVEDVLKAQERGLENLIRSSGFFRQKAERLKLLAKHISAFPSFHNFKSIPREQLLSIKGIGPETADSILLYACNRPYFVIDAYTRRMCSRLGVVITGKKNHSKTSYEEMRAFFESNIPKNIEIYKEFHALIVRWGKEGFAVL